MPNIRDIGPLVRVAARVLRRAHHDQHGQSLPLMLAAMGLALVGGAIVVDVGIVYAERRHAQAAVDFAALAAAQELPDLSRALPVVDQYLEGNDIAITDVSYSVATASPYNGNYLQIEVTLTHQLDSSFAALFGVDTWEVSARAVAGRALGGWAIYQSDSSCAPPGLRITGSDVTVNGNIHANGDLQVGGGSTTVNGQATYVEPCAANMSGSVVYGGTIQLPDPLPPSVDFEYDDFACDFTAPGGGDWQIQTSTPGVWQSVAMRTLNPGVYCNPNGGINLEPSNVNGNVTFVGKGRMVIQNGGFDLTAFADDVLIFTDMVIGGGPQIKISGNGGTFSGMLLAPNGKVSLEGGNLNSPATFIHGHTVVIPGGPMSLTAIEDPEYVGTFLIE